MTSTKHLLLTTASSLLLPLSTQANDIEPSKEFYTALKISTPIVLDGDLSEWTGATILADPRFAIPKGSGDDGTLVNFELHGGDWTGPDATPLPSKSSMMMTMSTSASPSPMNITSTHLLPHGKETPSSS